MNFDQKCNINTKYEHKEHVFEDKEELFYVIIEDELENRLDELRMYRKQQQSNHVNISLDIVTSPKSPICIPAPDKTGICRYSYACS